MTPIFTDPFVNLYPDPVRDSAPPLSSSDVPSLALSPAVRSPASDPVPSAPSASPTNLCCSTRQAMTDELDALHKTHTWDMTTLPPGKSAVGCKWVYKFKTRADGSVERYKALLVARGSTQEYGIDYEETFAPVARLTSVRSLLAVVAVHHWPLFQMDVKNAFLNSDLLEEGFTPSPYDSALFIRHTSTSITLILLYVDDMIITVTSFSDGYYFSQAKYASNLLSKAGLTDSKTVSTPLEFNIKLNATNGEPLPDATLYQQLVGSLIYLTVTRPNLAYAVHLVSQFMSAPRSTHYVAVLRILCALSTLRSIVTSFVIIFSRVLFTYYLVSSEDQLAEVFTKSHPPGRLILCPNSRWLLRHHLVFEGGC
uniref:Reverse transcriptase Ty1/copia-type domain-containing protein n=1 Tax=Fagus sylvatica TaxID=28930 RepID=A0A2N9HCR8_FAGSY